MVTVQTIKIHAELYIVRKVIHTDDMIIYTGYIICCTESLEVATEQYKCKHVFIERYFIFYIFKCFFKVRVFK
jgi:hypothetical protein